MVRRCAWALGVWIGGCQGTAPVDPDEPEPPPEVPWSTVCGTEGPHRLLDLSAGEHPHRVDRVPDEDRVLVSTFLVDPTLPLSSLPPTLDLVIHAVDPCGEDPVEIARGLLLTTRFEDLTLACNDGGHGAWVLDPRGVDPPRPILDGWCPLRATAQGLLTVEAPPAEDYGELVLLRDPADPQATPEPLAQDIRSARNTYFGPGTNASTSLWAKDDEAIVLHGSGEVRHLSLVDGSSAVEQAGVRELRVSSDGRFMIWQALEPTEGDPQTPVGPVFLRDREAGTDLHLLNTHLEWTGNPYAGPYLLLRDDADGLRVYWREGAQRIELPGGTDLRGVLADDRLWLVRREGEDTHELLWSPEGGEPVAFAVHQGAVTRRGEGIEIFESDAVPLPSEGALDFVSFEGGEPVRLADHVHERHATLADGRILTIVQEDETGHGPLRLIDPRTGGFIVLDWRGYVQSPRLNAGDPFDGDLVFATDGRDEDGRGLYRGRVEP